MAESDGETAEPVAAERAGSTPRNWSVFGDSLGVAVFLCALALAGSTWQVGFFITDTYAVANGLVNVAEGHLTIDRIEYSLTLGSQPGLHAVDGHLYARNYGQAVFALPAYYGLAVLTAVARLELVLAAGWSLLVVAACRQVGVVLDRRPTFGTAGSLFGLGLFGASVALAAPVEAELAGLVALQVLSLLAVAVTALALYRLCARFHGRRVGVVAGAGAVLATPLWFWAAVPKRHTLGAAVVAVLLYWFAASRGAGPRVTVPFLGAVRKAVVLRSLAYVLAGLVAWVHAFEGVVLLGTFALADLATASTTSRRALVAVAVGASVGLTPFVATNVFVSGNPVEPPRLTESYQPGNGVEIGPGGAVQPGEPAGGDTDQSGDPDGGNGSQSGESTGGDSGGTDSPVAGGGGSTTGGPSAVGALAERVRSSSAFGYASRIVTEASEAPFRLYHTYVRSGRIAKDVRYDVNDEETIELSLAESLPLAGALAGAFVGGLTLRLRTGQWSRPGASGTRSDGGAGGDGSTDGLLDTVRRHPVGAVRRLPGRVRRAHPARQTDGLALAVFAAYATLYYPLLPLHTQLTVRYVLPVVPALVYLVARRRTVRRCVATTPRSLVAGYVLALVAGVAAVAVAFPALDPAVGEAMQLHALVDLAVCGALAGVVTATRAGLVDDTRLAAGALGVAGAVTTLLVVRMQLVYFEYGTYAVPVVRRVADVFAVAA